MAEECLYRTTAEHFRRTSIQHKMASPIKLRAGVRPFRTSSPGHTARQQPELNKQTNERTNKRLRQE